MNLITVFPEQETWARLPKHLFPNVCPHYLVSIYGRIYNEATNNYLPSYVPVENAYITISLSTIDGSNIYVQPHRLVLMTFNYIEGCEFLDVNHKDGIKYNNWIWNLEWNTRSENIQHAINNNLFNLGETRDNTKYSNDQIEEVCELISKGLSTSEINSITGIDSKTIQNVKNGHCWKHISKNYDFSNMKTKNNFSNDDVRKICSLFEKYGTELGTRELLKKYFDIDMSELNKKEYDRMVACISGIRKKKTFKNICSEYNY